MLKRILFILMAIFILPQISYASLRISEVAWMGTADSSSNEWIELYNDGSESISLTGYKLTSIDDGLNVSLKGSIQSNSYYLIERTDDSSVPNISADLIASFGSGLSNAGETLKLINQEGSVIDEVVGGTSWKNIGGNSENKNTPQWTSSGWVTQAPTPRFAPSVDGVVSENSTSSVQDTQIVTISSSHSSSNSSSKKEEAPKVVRDSFKIVIKHDGNILKDSSETFTAKVFGLSDEELPNAKVIWNFGDGTTAEGKEVKHIFRFEGIYSLVVKASHNDFSTTVRMRVEVLNQKIQITDAKPGFDGYIKILSQNDTDISGFSLRSGGAKFVFPEGTMLYAKTPIIFANSITGIVNHSALALHHVNNQIISAFGDTETEIPVVYSNAVSYNKGDLNKKIEEEPSDKIVATSSTSSLLALTSSSGIGGLPNWIYLAVIAFFVIVIGIIIYISKVFNPNREIEDEAAKYTLVEIDSNLE